MSEYRKTPRNQRDKYIYHTVTGKIDITAEISVDWRETLHRMDDRIVDNNCKNGHPPMDEQQKAEKKEWEEAHPGERYPANWNISFEAQAFDPDLEEERTVVEIVEILGKSKSSIYRLIDKMTNDLQEARQNTLMCF